MSQLGMHDRSGVPRRKHVWKCTIWWCHLHEGHYYFSSHISSTKKTKKFTCSFIVTTFVFLLIQYDNSLACVVGSWKSCDWCSFVLQWILHDWNDEECVTILRNCFKALPTSGGKVIIVESVLPNSINL